MNRRTFLAAAGVTPFVGCVGTTESPGSETTTSEPESEPTTTKPHDLYIVNYTTTTEIATVHVRDEDGIVVDGRYELPSERGIEFADIGAWEMTYTVELTIADTALGPLTWETESCEAIEEAPRGSRDGYVQVRGDETDGHEATVAVGQCDAIYGPEYPTGPAEGFRVEE